MSERIQPSTGHETRDVSVRLLGWVALGLPLAAIIVFLLTAVLFGWFKQEHPSADAPSRIEFHPQSIAPPPRLQIDPKIDLVKFRAAEEAKLSRYSWVDRKAGIVRIPIERAMELIAERGVPVRKPGSADASGITPEQMQQQKAAAREGSK